MARNFVAHDIKTGAKRWTSKRCDFAQVAAPVGARSGSQVVVSCGPELRLLDLESGAYLWRYRSTADRSMLRVGGGMVAVSFGSTAKVLDLETGKLRFTWRPKTSQREDLVVAAGEGVVLIAEDEVLWGVEPDGSARWHRKVVGNSIWFGPYGVVIRQPQGAVSVVDPDTGKTRESRGTTQVNTSYAMIVDVEGDRVLVARDAGNPIVYGLNSRTGGFAWSTGPGKRWSYVAHGGGRVVVARNGSCEVRSITDGRRVAQCPPRVAAVALDDDRVAYLSLSDVGAGTISVKRLPD